MTHVVLLKYMFLKNCVLPKCDSTSFGFLTEISIYQTLLINNSFSIRIK